MSDADVPGGSFDPFLDGPGARNPRVIADFVRKTVVAWSNIDAAVDRGFLLGDGLFETVLVLDGQPQYLELHMHRIRRSGVLLGVSVPDDLEETIRRRIDGLWQRGGQTKQACLRVCVTRGQWGGFEPPEDGRPVGIHLVLRPMLDPSEHDEESVHLVTDPLHRIDQDAPLTGHKTLSWMSMVQARRDARARGADFALFLNLRGEIADTDAANLFFSIGQDVITPSIDCGALPGVMRGRVIERLRKSGYTVHERPIRMEEALLAREIFVTNALIGVAAVRRIDQTDIPQPRSLVTYLRRVFGMCRERYS